MITILNVKVSFSLILTGQDTCSLFEPGGPLVAEGSGGGLGQTKYLVGIFSFASRMCKQGYPAVYTSIDYYLPWIIDNMRP